MPPIKEYTFVNLINKNCSISINAYSEQQAKDYLSYIVKDKTDFIIKN